MTDNEEFTQSFERAKNKFKIAVSKYPIEMYEITKMFENFDDYKASEVQQAFKKLDLILEDIEKEISN